MTTTRGRSRGHHASEGTPGRIQPQQGQKFPQIHPEASNSWPGGSEVPGLVMGGQGKANEAWRAPNATPSGLEKGQGNDFCSLTRLRATAGLHPQQHRPTAVGDYTCGRSPRTPRSCVPSTPQAEEGPAWQGAAAEAWWWSSCLQGKALAPPSTEKKAAPARPRRPRCYPPSHWKPGRVRVPRPQHSRRTPTEEEAGTSLGQFQPGCFQGCHHKAPHQGLPQSKVKGPS